MMSCSFVSVASVVDAGHADSQRKNRKTAGPDHIAARHTNSAPEGQAAPSTGRLGKHAKRKAAERSDPLAGLGPARLPASTVPVATQEDEGHKAGRRKKQKIGDGDTAPGTKGNAQSARGTTGAIAQHSSAAAAAEGPQPGLFATEQRREQWKHDAEHEQGQQIEVVQDKLRKKRNRNKFKQPDDSGGAADRHMHDQPPVTKSKQGTQEGHEKQQHLELEQQSMPKERHRAHSKQLDEGATADWRIRRRLAMKEPKGKAGSGDVQHDEQQQAKSEQDTLRKKRSRDNRKQRAEAGQAAAYQSLQAKGPVQQALQQHSSSRQAPEVSELDHALSGKKQAARKKQNTWEADAQGNKMGGTVGKGAMEQDGQRTAGAQTAVLSSLKGARSAGKHTVTQDGQVDRRHALPGSLSAAGQSRPKQDSLLSKMRAKLSGSQFRWLNEQLYTCPGSQAFELMQEQPQLFTQYHEASPCLQAAYSPVVSYSFSHCAAT